MKTMIRKATVYDGTGNFPFTADVMIDGEKIARIGRDLDDSCDYEVDAAGLCLAPGFINTHSHSDLEVFKNEKMLHTLKQGITTEIVGQDGSSVAPLNDDMVQELADNMAPLAGVIDEPYWWRSYGEYLEEVRRANSSIRVEGLLGHGTVRMCVMGNDNREPTDAELAQMKAVIEQGMQEGAKGISLGLIYPPGSYGLTEELIEVCKVVAKYDGLMMVHMRNEQDQLLESIDEMARVARESGVRLHISHLKALGYRNWGNGRKALDKLYALREEGIDVTFDQYPYTATCTGLKVVVPTWAYEGGEGGFQNRLRDPEAYGKILTECAANIEARGGAEKIQIASVATEENRWMEGNHLGMISEKLGMRPEEAALHILKVEGPAVIAIYFSISEDDVSEIIQSDLGCICTDGIMGASPHPRLYGAFTRVLSYYCREKGLLTLQEAVRKMTSEPARRLRLWDRGLIREGMTADLVLFRFEEVKNTNSYQEPKRYPEGIIQVWVKGETRF